jgi:ABC-type transporter Mla maintaining outer membrane lipid asymmetry permease subunit MlaE
VICNSLTIRIDALRTMAIDLMELLLAPKHLGAMVAVPRLTVMSSAFVILAGAGFSRT